MWVRRLVLGICGVLCLVGPSPVAAQGGPDACPALVQQALDLLAEGCTATERNEACYGHAAIAASLRDASVTFAAPADRAPLGALESLQTAALDPASDTWGVALLRAQTDLPDALPGQNVTFLLLGDVDVMNEGRDQAATPSPPCTVTAAGNANLRVGPGTDAAVVGGVVAGDELLVTGQSAAGDWLRLQTESAESWIASSLVQNATCDFEAVPVVSAGQAADPTYGPMQAFTLQTGLGDPACVEAPPNALLIRAPQGETVNLRANGVDISLSSAVGLTAQPSGDLTLSVFEGAVQVAAFGTTRYLPAGFGVSVPLDATLQAAGAPSESFPLDPARWAALPAIPGPVFTEGTPLAMPAAGRVTTWTVTTTPLEGSGWNDSGPPPVETRTWPLSISGDGSVVAYKEALLHQTAEGTYHGEPVWDTQIGTISAIYDLTFTSETAFTMHNQVFYADGRIFEYQDEGVLAE